MCLFYFFSIKSTQFIMLFYHFDNYFVIKMIIFRKNNIKPLFLSKFLFFYYHFDNFQKMYYNYIKRKNYTGVRNCLI